jgi:ATP-binding cassette subfamily B protein
VQRFRESARLLWLAARLTFQASPRLMLVVLLLLVLQALLAPAQLALAGKVVDRAALDLAASGALKGPPVAGDGPAARLPLTAWIALAAATAAFGQLLPGTYTTFQSVVGDRLTGYVTERLIVAANGWRGVARFEDPGFADDLQRARTRAANVGVDVLVYASQTVLHLFTAAGLVALLFGLHPMVPLTLLAATLPHVFLQWDFRDRVGSSLYVQTPEARRLRYCREVVLGAEPAKDVRLYGLGPYFQRRYDAIFERTTGVLDRLRVRLSAQVALASALAAAAAGAVYLLCAWLVGRGERSLGDLALYGGAATLLQGRLLSLGFQIGFLPLPLSVLPSLFRVLDAPPDLPLPPAPRPAPRPIRRGIAFEHVAFAYPGRPAPVLRDVSFTLRPGECVALVGHNGAGKSTIVKLLLRLYDPSVPPDPDAAQRPGPQESARAPEPARSGYRPSSPEVTQPPGVLETAGPPGRILLDGVDLRDYDLAGLRRRMGVVFQNFMRYELTVAENVGLGRVAALDNREGIAAAIRRAGGADLLERLPQGLDTQLGREFGGRELSGGEWQKLALARAFVRDADVLVLDEPTAALDVQTEHDLYTRFRDLTRGKTTLLVSHRLSTVRMADRILYLADGRVQEAGSHDELLALNGDYARLYRLQASQYLSGGRAPQPRRS